MPEDFDNEEQASVRSFWSGTITFGLVSLPVSLYVANRRNTLSLRMLDEDGTPLARRYFCSRDGEPLSRDDIVRGYEIEKEKFIEVADEELEALMPEKSREIDLRRFVPLDDIDPMFFERAYFLVPDEGANKAYRLLARSMEASGRAGIATFVMRGKEYLIAIIAERGILRAETLRFHDELRTPGDVGLPPLEKPSTSDVKAIKQVIEQLSADALDRSELTDEPSQRLLQLIEGKLESGEDVVQAPEVPEPEKAEVIDLMQVLKQSLEASVETDAEQPRREQTERKAGAKAAKKPGGKTAGKEKEKPKKKSESRSAASASKRKKPVVDPDMSKSELYEQAKALDIPGRSHMSKDQLLREMQQRL